VSFTTTDLQCVHDPFSNQHQLDCVDKRRTQHPWLRGKPPSRPRNHWVPLKSIQFDIYSRKTCRIGRGTHGSADIWCPYTLLNKDRPKRRVSLAYQREPMVDSLLLLAQWGYDPVLKDA
jgi:hypothetical protein